MSADLRSTTTVGTMAKSAGFGRVSGRLLIIAVAFTERGDAIRIISARPAEPDEEAAYYEGLP